MKGKVKFFSRFIVCAMSVVLATGLLFAGIVLNKTKYANAAVTAGEKYSQKDEGDIVLSVEKVGVISTGDDYMSGVSDTDITNYNNVLKKYNSADYPFKTELFENAYVAGTENKTINQLYVDNVKAGGSWKKETFPSLYFKDIAVDASNSKTVYHSGDYIMLENNVKSKTVNGKNYTYYYNPTIKAYNQTGEVDMAEAVLFSFGSYRLGSRTDADNNTLTDLVRNTQTEAANYTYAKNIQQISVKATRNGSTIVLPVVRQYGTNNYQDFSYIIPQKAGFDGHYEFVVEYRHNEEFKRQTFSFDLVFKSTYTEPETFENGSGYAYATMPKLELPTTGTTNYILGSNVQYPTLTYDFSKYTLDYTHTLNGVTTTYSYRRVKELSLVGVNYKLVCTVSSPNGVETKAVGLTDETKAVLLFTEIGDYKFDYDYIYNDEQNDMGFSLNSDNLTITGFELKYAKVGFDEAQMRYLKINKHKNDKVVLLVPNGYELNKENTSSTLGVAYSVELTTGSTKTGVVNNSQDALINASFTAENMQSIVDDAQENLSTSLITSDKFQTTNQGGVWLSSNINYVENGSFYYYSRQYFGGLPTDKIKTRLQKTGEESDRIFKNQITNTTTFNQIGYYLVFVKATNAGENFYQVFAFRYSNETTNIEVNALTVDENGNPVLVDGEKQYTTPIGSGKFTRQNVKISWVEPGVFERNVVVKYYSNKNVYLTKYDEKANGTNLLTSSQMISSYTAREITNGTVLGSDLAEKQGASFLIEATNEGQAKTYRSFTVDRTEILGVSMYAVKTATGATGSLVYSIQTDEQGEYAQISAITDGLATIAWDDKLSGANVRANYYFTPIIKDDSQRIEALNNTSSSIWFINKYKLGNQTGPFYIDKPENLDYTLDASNIVKNNGVYLFVLTDEAGNSCKFMFVCDSTEQYFLINEEYYSQESVVFASDIDVEFGTHKAIKLFDENKLNKTETEKIVELFVENSADNRLKENGYYINNKNNIYDLQGLFSKNGKVNYLTVKNELLTAYEHEDKKAEIKISKTDVSANPSYRVNKNDKNQNATSYNVKINIYSQNQYGYSNNKVKNDSNSFVWIEINDDHSLGKVYFAADQSLFGDENIARRLYTGSDNKNDLSTRGIEGAHATSDNLVAFYFNQGTGEYEIESITYDYYPITNSWNSENGNMYFYNSKTSYDLFKKGEDLDQAPFGKISTSRYYRAINIVDNQTQEGLYVVTRTFVGGSKQDYWFIVDRKSVIENTTEGEVGKFINVKLLEETEFNTFDKFGLAVNDLVYYAANGQVKERINYTLSLETNKVPAEVKVPVGKYFDSYNASTYEAGRLNLTIYYFDRYGQVGARNDTKTPIVLFSSKDYVNGLSVAAKKDYYTKISQNGGYLTVNLDEYLTGTIHDKYILKDGNGKVNWLWLPGDYVVVVEDNVVSSSSTAHKTAFGFKIVNNTPATDVYSVVDQNNGFDNANAKADSNFKLTTGDEFVKVELPKYETVLNNQNADKVENAQIDPDYLVVKRSVDGGAEETYLDFKYSYLGGKVPMPDKEASTGTRTLSLDTGLVRNNGVVDFENSAKNIVYTIFVRFKISQGESNYNEKYKHCYQYYEDGKLTSYYETKYVVTIDRVPPTANTLALEKLDKLATYYNQEDEVESMFKLSVHETTSGLYFVNELAKYYQTNDVKDLYAFVVNPNTRFDNTDISKMYYKEISNLSGVSLNAPIINFTSYEVAQRLTTAERYGNIFEISSYKGYYEIVEIDAAGNQNQYIILYNTKTEDLSFSFNAIYMKNGEIANGTNGTGEKVTLNSLNTSITLFELNSIADSAETEPIDKFYRVELVNLSTLNKTVINTNATTKFTNSGLTAQIVDAIKTAGRGNYSLKISSRANEQTFAIDYYDQNNRVELNARNLVEKVGNGYNINLQGANVKQDGILYYAKEIKVTQTIGTKESTNIYYGQNVDGEFNYYSKDTNKLVDDIIHCDDSSTYQIVMTDAFGSVSTCRFDTEKGFDNFHNIQFEGNTESNNKYFESANHYYGYTASTINFNTALYKKLIVSYQFDNQNKVDYLIDVVNGKIELKQNGTKLNDNDAQATVVYTYSSTVSQTIIDITLGRVVLYPFVSTANGAVVNYSVELWYNDAVEFTYNVCLDSATKTVTLKNTDNVETKMAYQYNASFQEVSYETISSGVMNLMWTPMESEHFTYQYILHEKMADDSVVDYDLTKSSSRVINTLAESKGVYWFEIKVYTIDGKYLGNKVYAFSVVAILTDLYYVQTEDMVAIKANSYFTFTENNLGFDSTLTSQLKLSTETELALPITNIPLFISNKKLTVIVSEEQGANFVKTQSVEYDNISGKRVGYLTLYRVYTKSYSRYFALLEIDQPADESIASAFEFVYDSTTDGNTSKNTVAINNFVNSIYIENNKNLTLSFGQTSAMGSNITRKNSIVLKVYHNGKLLENKQVNNNGGQVNYQVKGAGKYSFEICDLAGNTHKFNFDDEQGTLITVNVMKNVYFTMNGNAPIENAVFNEQVELAIYEPFNYDSINTKPVEIKAYKNGKECGFEQKNYTYIFSEYGNYKVILTAKYNGQELTSTINFSIINKNEARASYDLTNVTRYNILNVSNQNGKDVTEEFLDLINPQTGNGRLLTYQTVISNAEALDITAGKQSFKIVYEVNDGIYPSRQAEFMFTLNDEIPTIECSVELGKTTKEGFDITFNPGIIYEQVGDSYLYINDTLVCAVNENSSLEQKTYSITEKENGAGDYYVKLVGSSGSVITSFKVVVKEPLNVWAIIIIVVVVAIVLGVTITIIVLRNKMRIR